MGISARVARRGKMICPNGCVGPHKFRLIRFVDGSLAVGFSCPKEPGGRGMKSFTNEASARLAKAV